MRAALFACGLVVSLLAATETWGAEQKIEVEFNDLQQAEGACRAVFVLHNGLEKPLDQLTLRVVAFDAKNHARLFLSLDVGALPGGKTRVLRFDLGSGLGCNDVTRLVLDDVIDCSGSDMNPAKCLAALELSSRAAVPFDF